MLFIDDTGCNYASHLGGPLGWLHFLLEPTPISVRPFDLIMLVVLMVGLSKRNPPLVRPMRNALLLAVATTIVWFLYGVFLRGGDARSVTSWQGLTSSSASSFLPLPWLSSIIGTAADFNTLGTWLLVAAIWRAIMCWISYFTWARSVVGESGAFLTTHDDTITWVVGIIVLIVNAADKRVLRVTIRNLALILFLLGAIQFNSRRLAWVSLAMGLVVMYALLPYGTAKRRISRAFVRFVLPLVIAYVVIGWGSSAWIFLPLRSLTSISTQEDASTLARNTENLGLIQTANYSSFTMGTGWGRGYVPVSLKYDISAAFALWPYVPHNSILGLLAFTGVFGFMGFWLALPTAVFLNARTAKVGKDAMAARVAIVGTAQIIVCANQFYGDMGIFFPRVMYVVAVGYAVALRLPQVVGVWGQPKAAGKGR